MNKKIDKLINTAATITLWLYGFPAMLNPVNVPFKFLLEDSLENPDRELHYYINYSLCYILYFIFILLIFVIFTKKVMLNNEEK
ncbi:hypothetical protein CNQ81_22880 [Bacillus cereus]|nr:hypothetical protein CNQ76_23375 [Bacillus cereus]PDR74693.1 hypothetical protein CNQ81_22880 [Bacillus cereus]PDR81892.1 hypothetical protein CNQ79_15750 [Bacillus cereus]PDR86705.1 hypothetical protein CNQ77_21235 [Bacillus cereus]PDR91951.1 hypothetical protein CNQ78_24610 [Bacillus cereus]